MWVVGSSRTESWQDKQGQKRTMVKVYAEEMMVSGGRSEAPSRDAAPTNSIAADPVDDNQDIPF